MMYNGDYTQQPLGQWKIGIVVSRFNELITNALHLGAIETLTKAGIQAEFIDTCWVPGAHEIPLILQTLAQTKKYQGLLALGCVIKGDTAHFEVVVDAVNQGTLKVSLEQNIPITTGVLTTYTLDQALCRSQGANDHKGKEAALALLELISLRNSINS